MANLPKLLSLTPLTPADLRDDLNYLIIPDDELQLQADTLNVLEGRVDINTFDAEYQERIKNYYRFSATKMNTNEWRVAKRTEDTLDII